MDGSLHTVLAEVTTHCPHYLYSVWNFFANKEWLQPETGVGAGTGVSA